MKNLRIDRGLVKDLSRSLNSDFGSSHWGCYPNCRNSHVSKLAVPVVHLDRSSMLARIQVSPYTSFTIRTCTGSPSPLSYRGINLSHPHLVCWISYPPQPGPSFRRSRDVEHSSDIWHPHRYIYISFLSLSVITTHDYVTYSCQSDNGIVLAVAGVPPLR